MLFSARVCGPFSLGQDIEARGTGIDSKPSEVSVRWSWVDVGPGSTAIRAPDEKRVGRCKTAAENQVSTKNRENTHWISPPNTEVRLGPAGEMSHKLTVNVRLCC